MRDGETAALKRHKRGFTLIELLVVLAILAVLLTLAVPRYFASVDASRETALQHNLKEVRDTLDKFRGDTGRYPDSLQELVDRGYLRGLPVDPMTESTATWELVAPPAGTKGSISDLRSTAPGRARDGRLYSEW